MMDMVMYYFRYTTLAWKLLVESSAHFAHCKIHQTVLPHYRSCTFPSGLYTNTGKPFRLEFSMMS